MKFQLWNIIAIKADVDFVMCRECIRMWLYKVERSRHRHLNFFLLESMRGRELCDKTKLPSVFYCLNQVSLHRRWDVKRGRKISHFLGSLIISLVRLISNFLTNGNSVSCIFLYNNQRNEQNDDDEEEEKSVLVHY